MEAQQETEALMLRGYKNLGQSLGFKLIWGKKQQQNIELFKRILQSNPEVYEDFSLLNSVSCCLDFKGTRACSPPRLRQTSNQTFIFQYRTVSPTRV